MKKKMTKKLKRALLWIMIVSLMFIGLPLTAKAEGKVLKTADIKHTHSNANTNPCYTNNPKWEVVDRHWTCTICGDSGWGAPYIWDSKGHGSQWTCDDERYGWVSHWSLTCTHSNEKIATFDIVQNGTTLTGVLTPISGNNLGTISYQWKEGSTVLSSTASYEITKAGTFTCYVTYTDPYSNKTVTTSLSITITYSAVISADTATSTSTWAKSATLTCDTVGGTTTSYQWYKDGSAISGATGKTYVAKAEGDYHCVAKGTNGTATSDKLHLYIDTTAPQFGKFEYEGSQYLKEVPVTMTYSDSSSTGVSGVASLTITKDGATVDTLVADKEELVFIIKENGNYTLTLTDNAGNTQSRSIKINNVDSEEPVLKEIVKKNEDGSLTPTYNTKKVIHVTATDNIGVKSILCVRTSDFTRTNGNVELKEGKLPLINETFEDRKEASASFTVESEDDNVQYQLVIVDKAGNKKEQSFWVKEVDTTDPKITFSRTSTTSTSVTDKVTMTDNKKVSKLEVSLNGTIKKTIDLTDVKAIENVTLDNNGAWEFKVYDDAGHTAVISDTVTNIVKNYTLDEDASMFHVHYGTNASTSKNGCYDEPYQNWEVVGYHTESAHQACGGHGITSRSWTSTDTCGACGSQGTTYHTEYGYTNCSGQWVSTGWHRSFDCWKGGGASAGGGTTGGSARCDGYTRYWQEPDYGWVTRYTCTKLANPLGYITLRKLTDGDYRLAIEDNTNEHAEIISYAWTGRDTTSKETEFPSIHPNGGEAKTVTGQKEAVVVIPDFGYYTCTVTYKDKYSGGTYKLNYYYMVEDYDLEPPVVQIIQDHIYDETLGYDDNDEESGEIDIFYELPNTDEPFATAYKEKTTLTLSLTDNMCLAKIECASGNLNFTQNLNRKLAQDIDITFTENGIYTFNLYDAITNCYTFKVIVRYIDTENPEIKAFVSTPTFDKESAHYTLQVEAEDFSKMYYKWLRKDHETEKVEVYKDWSSEKFVDITDNGAYAVMVADSVYYNKTETEPVANPSYLSSNGRKHITTYNLSFNDPKLNYWYCDTEPPKVSYTLRATPRFVIVTINATDNQTPFEDLVFTCNKYCKQDHNLFYVTQNGTYKYTVTDACGNDASVSIYVDFDELTGNRPSIIKDITATPLGKHVTYDGKDYSNTGFTYSITFKDFVDKDYILTKLNADSQYKKITKYTVEKNGADTLFSRYTKDETVNTGEIEYQTKLLTEGVDKEIPEITISVKNGIAYIVANDKTSGVGKIEVEKRTTTSQTTSYVDYSKERMTSVTYALSMDYNTIYGIKVYDNVENESVQYYVSTDGVLTGGISNLFIVVFVDSNGSIISEQYLIKGANAVAPSEPQKDGCTFLKWSTEFTNVKTNLLVYPVYTSNATGLILDEEIHYDEALRYKLKGNGFMFSNGGDGEVDIDKAEVREITDGELVQETTEVPEINLSEDDIPRAYYKKYVYKYSGVTCIILLVFLICFKEWQERKRIE